MPSLAASALSLGCKEPLCTTLCSGSQLDCWIARCAMSSRACEICERFGLQQGECLQRFRLPYEYAQSDESCCQLYPCPTFFVTVRHSQGHQRRGAPCEVYLWPQFTRPSNLCPSPVASTQSTGAAAIGRHKGTRCDAGCRMVPTCIGSGDCTCTLQTPEATACGRGRLQSCRATASAPNIRLQLASDSSRRQCQELQVHGTQLRIRWRQCGT